MMLALALSLAVFQDTPIHSPVEEWELCQSGAGSHLNYGSLVKEQGVTPEALPAISNMTLKFSGETPDDFDSDAGNIHFIIGKEFTHMISDFPEATVSGTVLFGGENGFPCTTSALSTDDIPVQQSVVGLMTSEKCNAIANPDLGLMMIFPEGALDFSAWKEGGFITTHFTMPHGLALRVEPLPEGVGEMSELTQELRVRAISAPLPENVGPTIHNTRVEAGESTATFDLLQLTNPGKEPYTFSVKFSDLGWDRPKRWRLAANWDVPELLGGFRRTFIQTVPGKTTTTFVLRPEMPRGVFAASSSPFSQRVLPWIWHSQSASLSGSSALTMSFEANQKNSATWVMLSMADQGKTPPFEVGEVLDEKDRPLPFHQVGAAILIQGMKPSGDHRLLKIRTIGRLSGNN